MAEKPSAAKEALSKVEDQLSCPVCLDPYTHPRLLACFHVYCEHCLDQMVVHDGQGQLSVTCPKCRRSTPLPPSGVTGLQAAFHVHHLFDIQETLKKIKEPHKLACEKCSVTTRPATSFCRQCTEFICDLCSTMHKEWKEFKGHEVVSMEKVEGDLIRLVSPKKVTPRCTKHNKNLKLYCESCEELICRDCTVHIHKDHKYCLISDTIESHKEEILVSLEPVEKQLEATNTALIGLDGRRDEIVARSVTMETKIHETFNEIHRTLKAREAELMAQLEGHTQQQLKKLSAQREEVEILQTQRESCVHFVRESIRSGSPGDVLKMKAGVVKQVRELVDTFDPHTLEPCEQATTSFIPSAQLVKHCKEFGRLCHVDLPQVSKVGVKSTARIRVIAPTKQLVPEAQLVSRLTDQTTKCVVTERGKGEYKISYQPTVGGAHQLHVRVGGEEVRGSPFPVTVKTPVDKLGAVIKTIDGVEWPWGVAVNKGDEVIVAQSMAGCVSIYTATGDKLRTLDTRGTAVGQMKEPQGMAVDSEGNILVVDACNQRLLKFSQEGDLITAVGSKGDGPGQFKSPCGMCVNSVNGKVYVVDNGAHCVHILNSDLTFSSKFGRGGSGDGQFNRPWDIAADSTGCVYVADAGNNRAQVFTSDGGYLRQFGKKGNGSGELKCPVSICVDSDDLVYVGESGNYCVSVFTSEGEFLNSFGSEGSRPGQFKCPYGIAVGGGVVYVCDISNSRVQLF